MTRSLHEEFEQSEHKTPAPTQTDDIVRRLKELLYTLPTGRHLVDFLNLHQIPVIIRISDTPGYEVQNHAAIILSCPPAPDIPLYEMAIHLGCGIRIIELHMQTYLSPEMKDSRVWQNPHLIEPFEVMLVICKLAYDMNYFSKNPEVEKFLSKNNFEKVYSAYTDKNSDGHIEGLMLQTFNERN